MRLHNLHAWILRLPCFLDKLIITPKLTWRNHNTDTLRAFPLSSLKTHWVLSIIKRGLFNLVHHVMYNHPRSWELEQLLCVNWVHLLRRDPWTIIVNKVVNTDQCYRGRVCACDEDHGVFVVPYKVWRVFNTKSNAPSRGLIGPTPLNLCSCITYIYLS